jgi:hypothetical protein
MPRRTWFWFPSAVRISPLNTKLPNFPNPMKCLLWSSGLWNRVPLQLVTTFHTKLLPRSSCPEEDSLKVYCHENLKSYSCVAKLRLHFTSIFRFSLYRVGFDPDDGGSRFLRGTGEYLPFHIHRRTSLESQIMFCSQQDCKWCSPTPSRSIQTLYWHFLRSKCHIVSTIVNVTLLTSKRKVWPSLRRFSRNSQILDNMKCHYTQIGQ